MSNTTETLLKRIAIASAAGFPLKLLLGLQMVLDFVDTDLHASNAGQAFRIMSASDKSSFAASWEVPLLPFVGDFVAWLGLPVVMVMITLFATVLQLEHVCRHGYFERGAVDCAEIQWPDPNDKYEDSWKLRHFLWLRWTHAMDAGSMLVLSAITHKLDCLEISVAKQALNPNGADPPHCCESMFLGPSFQNEVADRGVAFKTKVAGESAPSLWFSVSLLSLTFNHIHIGSKALQICSVSSSILSSLRNIPPQVQNLWVRRSGIGRDHGIAMRRYWTTVFLLIGCVAIVIGSLARLVGVWYCSDHILNLTSGCVKV